MKKFIASVKDENNNILLIEREYSTKKEFEKDLRNNGYKIRFISNENNFDYDMEKYYSKLENNKAIQKIKRDIRNEVK